jgi:hypothetical protein
VAGEQEFITVPVINGNGSEICVQKKQHDQLVMVIRNGITTRIRLSTWNANRKYYEKKYGQLPPSPADDLTFFTRAMIKEC